MRLSRTQQCARLVQGRRSRLCDKTLYGWGVNLHHVHELDRRRLKQEARAPSLFACRLLELAVCRVRFARVSCPWLRFG